MATMHHELPGEIAMVPTCNQVFVLTQLSYTGRVTPVTESVDEETGELTWTPGTPADDQPWLTWSRRYNIDGNVAAEWNGAGAAFDGTPGVSDPTRIEAPSVG